MAACLDCGGSECICRLLSTIKDLEATIGEAKSHSDTTLGALCLSLFGPGYELPDGDSLFNRVHNAIVSSQQRAAREAVEELGDEYEPGDGTNEDRY